MYFCTTYVGTQSTKLQKSNSEHFWKAAVDFVSSFDNEHREVKVERSGEAETKQRK